MYKGTILKGILPKLKWSKYLLVYRSSLGTFWYTSYIQLKDQRDAHEIFSILYYTVFALHVSGTICTNHQELKQQSAGLGTCDCYGVLEVG
jgi:hypothetical protein